MVSSGQALLRDCLDNDFCGAADQATPDLLHKEKQ